MARSALAAAMLLAALGLATGGCGGDGATGSSATTVSGPGAMTAGKAVFVGVSQCGGCHTLADAGATGTVASNLDETRPSDARIREVVTNGTGAMPSYRESLTPQEIADVAAYVSSVAGR